MNKKAVRFILILLGIVVIVILSNITMRSLPVSVSEVRIDYKGGDTLVDRAYVVSKLHSKFGDLAKKKRKEVHAEQLEAYLMQQNFISKANVFLSLTGKLNIDIVQNRAIVRVYTSNGGQFYIDDDMQVCSSDFPKAANVIIASGELKGVPKAKSALDTAAFPQYHTIYNVAKIISEDDILRNQIDQIFFSKKEGLQLIPKVGDYVILLGQAGHEKEKLNKLHYLYKDGFSKHGWDNYSLVDLKFENQVVCTRK